MVTQEEEAGQGGAQQAKSGWAVPKTPGYRPNSFNRGHNNTALFSKNEAKPFLSVHKRRELRSRGTGKARPGHQLGTTKRPSLHFWISPLLPHSSAASISVSGLDVEAGNGLISSLDPVTQQWH